MKILNSYPFFLSIIISSCVWKSSEQRKDKDCIRQCGNIIIPYPFGIGPDHHFAVSCNSSSSSQIPILKKLNLEILEVRRSSNEIVVNIPSVTACNGTVVQWSSPSSFDGFPFYIQDTNVFASVGCHGYAFFYDNSGGVSGCTSVCAADHLDSVSTSPTDMMAQCYGFNNCCQLNVIPQTIRLFEYNTSVSANNGSGQCRAAFLVSREYLANLASTVPMMSAFPVMLQYLFPDPHTVKIMANNFQNTQSVTQDVSSIYYIHPSENPTVSLVSEKFNGDNYADWKRGMILAFSMKNKLAFIDGSVAKPEPGDMLFSAWERCNNMVISYLLRSMDNTISKSVMFFNTAEEIWNDLEERYSVISGPQFYSLQQSLSQISQGNTSVAEFFTKIKGMWDQISAARPMPMCTCNGCSCNLTKKFFKAQQDERLIHFLMKLDNKHGAVRTNILMMNPLPTISTAYNLLVQDERQKEVSETYKQHSAMVFAAADEKKVQQGQSVSNTSRFLYRRNSTMYCDHCKIPGHTVDRCFKIHGYPPKQGYGKAGKNKRIAAVVYNDEDTNEENQTAIHFNKAQYDQFVSFMKQNKEAESDTIGTTNTAGSLIEKFSGSW